MTTDVKGKGRAAATSNERTPLITSPALSTRSVSTPSHSPRALRHGRGPIVRESDDGHLSDDDDPGPRLVFAPSRAGHRIARKVFCVAGLSLLALIAIIAVILHVWIGHVVSERSAKLQVEKGVVLETITAVRIMNDEARNGFTLEVDGRAGVDIRSILAYDDKEEKGWRTRFEEKVLRWSIHRINTVSLELDGTTLSQGQYLDVVQLDHTRITLPLSYPSKQSPHVRVNSFTLSLPLRVSSSESLGEALRSVWKVKRFDAIAKVDSVTVTFDELSRLGVLGWIVERFGTLIRIDGMSRSMQGTLPVIPEDPSSLVVLDHYSIYEAPTPDGNNTVIALAAFANLTNPLYNSTLFDGLLSRISWTFPWSIPLEISLPSSAPSLSSSIGNGNDGESDILLARVSTAPLSFLAHQQITPIVINGQLVRQSKSTSFSDALSGFLAKFLSGEVNTIHVRYDAASNPDGASSLPPFVAPVMANVTVPLSFPGSKSTLALFKNLQIEEMKIRLSSMSISSTASLEEMMEKDADLLCSGRVVGEINLPQEMDGLANGIDITNILPDVYVYNGEPPLERRSLSSSALMSSMVYPPIVLPSNAFAQLRPTSFIHSTTIHSPSNATHNATTYISATFIDAPLYLLEGRAAVFRDLVAKLVFGSQKVRAGIRGVAEVALELKGAGEVELDKLPIEGSFFISPQNPTRLQ